MLKHYTNGIHIIFIVYIFTPYINYLLAGYYFLSEPCCRVGAQLILKVIDGHRAGFTGINPSRGSFPKDMSRGVGTGPAGPAATGPIFRPKGRFIQPKGVRAGDCSYSLC